MTRRVVLGPRSNGNNGIFVSPPGVDAYTAADNALLLSIFNKISQLLLLGQVPSSSTVALGLGKNPIVILTSQNPFSDLGINGIGNLSGPSRPSPCATLVTGPSISRGNLASAVINSNGASMSITTSVKTFYAVYNRAMP